MSEKFNLGKETDRLQKMEDRMNDAYYKDHPFQGVDFNEHFADAKAMRESVEKMNAPPSPLEAIRDYAERRNLKPHELLVITLEKTNVKIDRDTRTTINWIIDRKASVERALGPDMERYIRTMEKQGYAMTVSHPDRYSRDLDKWAKEPSRDLEPIRDRK